MVTFKWMLWRNPKLDSKDPGGLGLMILKSSRVTMTSAGALQMLRVTSDKRSKVKCDNCFSLRHSNPMTVLPRFLIHQSKWHLYGNTKTPVTKWFDCVQKRRASQIKGSSQCSFLAYVNSSFAILTLQTSDFHKRAQSRHKHLRWSEGAFRDTGNPECERELFDAQATQATLFQLLENEATKNNVRTVLIRLGWDDNPCLE